MMPSPTGSKRSSHEPLKHQGGLETYQNLTPPLSTKCPQPEPNQLTIRKSTSGGTDSKNDLASAEPKEPRFSMGVDSLLRYFRDAARVPLITREEELELARRKEQGDEAARERMILSNLRLVIAIAKNFEGLGLALLDLINEGNIGLMRAVDRFDPVKAEGTGAKLSTYASHWIKQNIMRALASTGSTIRLPIQRGANIRKMINTEQRLTSELDREPTDAELAEAMDISTDEIKRYRDNDKTRRLIPLDSPVTSQYAQGDTRTLQDLLPDYRTPLANEELPQREMNMIISAILGVQSDFTALAPHLQAFVRRERRIFHPRELYILERRYGLCNSAPCTLQELGTEIGITRERIRQVEAKALRKLRSVLEKLNGPRDLLEEEVIDSVTKALRTKSPGPQPTPLRKANRPTQD